MHVLELEKPTPFDVMLREEFPEDIAYIADQIHMEEVLAYDPDIQLDVRLVAHARCEQLRMVLREMVLEAELSADEEEEEVQAFLEEAKIFMDQGVAH